MPIHVASFKKLQPYLDQHLGTIYGIELQLYSDELRAAGTMDLFGVWKNQLTIIDFKTSLRVKKQEHIGHYFVQATAYSMMLKEVYGIDVPRLCIMIMVDGHEVQLFEKDCQRFHALTKKIFSL